MAATHAAPGWLLLASVLPCAGFYLPGVAPIEYEKGHKVDLKVNKLTSTKTQLPYEWCSTPPQRRPSEVCGHRALAVCRYSLPFCKPEEVVNQAENLGEVWLPPPSALCPGKAALWRGVSMPGETLHPLTRAQVMRGDRVMNSPYDIKMHLEESCKVRAHAVCTGPEAAAAAAEAAAAEAEAGVRGAMVRPW